MTKNILTCKAELIALYAVLMIVGFSFTPPLLYTRYAMELGVILAVAITWDVVEDWARVQEWTRF